MRLRDLLLKEFGDDYIVDRSNPKFALLLSLRVPLVMRPEKVASELMNWYFYRHILSGKGIAKLNAFDRPSKATCQGTAAVDLTIDDYRQFIKILANPGLGSYR